MGVQAAILGMEAIMEEVVQITMEIMGVQAITLAAEVVLTTMETMGDLVTTPVTMATMAVVDQITTATTEAAQVGMGDQGGTQGPRSTGKWSVPLSELFQ